MTRLIVLWASIALAAGAQTTVDLARQARGFDFAQAIRTRPVKTGESLPLTCDPGDLFFKTAAQPGQNLHGCVDPNSWAVLAGSGSGPTASLQLNDMRVIRTDNTTLSLNNPCLSGTPCNYRIGAVAYSIVQPSTLTLAGTSGSGTAYIYLDGEGVKVGLSGMLDATCSAGCVVLPASPGFPLGSIPLFTWASTAQQGQWDATGNDLRGLLATDPLEVGLGLARIVNPNGTTRIELDGSSLPRLVALAGAPQGSCIAGRDLYLDSASGDFYACTEADTWRLVAGMVQKTGLLSALPACTAPLIGQRFRPTDALSLEANCTASGWVWQARPLPVNLPPASANWTALNAATVADQNGAVTWSAATANGEVQGMVRPVPASTPYTVIYGMDFQAQGTGAACGALWTSGTANTSAAHTVSLNTSAELSVRRWSNLATEDSQDVAPLPVLGAAGRVYFRLQDDGVNRSFGFSTDGVNFQTVFSGARATPFTPTHAGVYCQGVSPRPLRGGLFHVGSGN